MDTVLIDAGTLEFSEEDLTATGLLVPFGVKARSNLGEFEVGTGAFSVPSDLTGASLNIEHKREDVVGGLSKVWEQPEGVLGTFKFAATDEGRKAFAEAKSGKRKHLSAEVAKVVIRGGKAISGRIFGAALVERPAFAGATLLAAEDTPGLDEEYSSPESSSSSQYITEFTDDNGVKWRRVEESIRTTTVTKVTPDPEAAPAEESKEEEEVTVTASATAAQPAGVAAPGTLLASTAKPKEDEVDLGTVFAAMAQLKTGMAAPDAETLLATLSDIKWNASGGLTTAASGVLQPAWVGKLWQGKKYQRKWLAMFTHTFGGIQLGGRKGFKLAQGTALVTKWSGNKTEIGSGTASTSVTGSAIQPYGYAADTAREWYDLEGGAEVIQAFFEGVVDSYAEVTDVDALTSIFDVASKTSVALDRLVAPETYPDEYSDALGQLIQGIEAIQDANDDPSGAIVNPAAWKQLIYTPKDLVPEYVKFAVRTGGEADADDGKVIVRKGPASAFVGIDPAEPATIVGAKRAIEFRELGTTPIQVDALNIAKGGIDKAIIGYLETFVVRPESLVLIGTAAE